MLCSPRTTPALRSALVATVTVVLAGLCSVARGQVVTVSWDDKSDGQLHDCLGPNKCVIFPDNNNWNEDRVIGAHPFNRDLVTVLRPGNWTSELYPDNGRGGVNYDVVVSSASAANLNINATIERLVIGSVGVLSIRTRSALTLRVDSTIDGLLRLDDQDPEFTLGNNATLRIDGDRRIDGTGMILFSSFHHNDFETVTDGDTLTLGPGITLGTRVSGVRGSIPINLVSNGVIDIDKGLVAYSRGGAGALPKTLTNNNLLRIRNAGRLSIDGGSTLDNRLGTITIDATSGFDISGRGGESRILGGRIDGGGAIDVDGLVSFHGPMTLDDLSITVSRGNGTQLTLIGNVTNGSTIRLNDTHPNALARARLRIDGDVTLHGAGRIVFLTNRQNEILAADPADVLTLGAGQTLTTAGSGTQGIVAARLVNHGTVDAAGGLIRIANGNMTNTNRIQGTDGGTISIEDTAVVNAGAVHEALTGGTLRLERSTVSGGSVVAQADGFITLDGGTVENATFGGGSITVRNTSRLDTVTMHTVPSTFTVVPGGTLVLRDTILRDATVFLHDNDSRSNHASLRIDGDIALTGVGSVFFNTARQNDIESVDPIDTLTVGPDIVLATRGPGSSGDLRVNVINNGRIVADDGTIHFRTGMTLTNNNLLHVRNAGHWAMTSASTLENTGGTITIDPSSTFDISRESRILGGRIDGGGLMSVSSGVFEGVGGLLLDGVRVAVGVGSLTLSGHITNNGLMSLRDNNTNSLARSRLRIEGDVTLDGTGELRFLNNMQNEVLANAGGGSLTIGPEHTVSAPTGTGGSISLDLSSHGTIRADGRLSVRADTFRNEAEGRLTGTGRLELAVTNFINLGTTSPGASAGVLTIAGHYRQAAASRLRIEIGGTIAGDEYDRLRVEGPATLDGGDLVVSLIDGFVPSPADTFTILTATSLTGFFANAPPDATGVGRVEFDGERLDVMYNAGAVVLGNFQPAGDCDDDGDTDLADYLEFQRCFTGPDGVVDPSCACADLDGDGDVDLADLVAAQAAFTGAR